MISQAKWKWFGYAGHFIGGNSCYFHLCTQVGKYLISTVGEYHSLDGKRQEIGVNRYLETMVFKAGKICDEPTCMCGQPRIDGSELDFDGYKTAGEAQAGHIKMCQKWAAGDRQLGEG